MLTKSEIVFLLLIGILQLCRCENKTYDLVIPEEETNETDATVKMESSHFSEKSTDDKSLNKRRSYYEGKGDKSSEYEYSQRARYDFHGNSDFPSHLRSPYHNDRDKGYESRKESFDWEKDRNHMPHNGGMEERRTYSGNMEDRRPYSASVDRSDIQDRRSSQHLFGERLEWEKPADFFNPAQNYRVKDDRDFRYESNFPNSMDMTKASNSHRDNNEDRRTSFTHSHLSHKDYEKSNDFTAAKEVVSRLHPRFHIPSSMDYAINNDFPLDDPEMCKEKAIIINLKTECPLSRHSRNRIVHKYLFPSKTPSSQLLSTNQYYSDPDSALFYV